MIAKQIANALGAHQSQHALMVLEAVMDFSIPSKNIAALLNITPTTISSWRSGRHTISEQHQLAIYRLVQQVIDSKSETIKILREAGKWDATTKRIFLIRYNHLTKLYESRPERFREKNVA